MPRTKFSMRHQLARDANGNFMQTASKIVCEDAGHLEGSPSQPRRASPVALAAATVQEFVVPNGAVAFIFRGSATLRYSDRPGCTGTLGNGYKIADADTDIVVPCEDMDQIYIRGDGAATTPVVDFCFEILKG